jgi:sulfhydrogenase subunit delta
VSPQKPRVAVFKLSSCDGCQLQLLDAEDALLALAERVDIVHFREARSRSEPGPYDVTLVEGSISTPEQIEEVKEIRGMSRFLVTIGACATAGGIQALRNWQEEGEALRTVYPSPEFVSTLATSTPVSDHVTVDLELPGCPVDRGQLLGALAALLSGTVPRLSTAPVCIECKRRGYECVLVTRGEPCLGPVTRTGCGALCPAFARACYGCFGPIPDPNTLALFDEFVKAGLTPERAAARFRFITGWAPAMREVPPRVEEGVAS